MTTAKHYTDTYKKVISAKISENAKIISVEKLRSLFENSDKYLRFHINTIFRNKLDNSDLDYFAQRIYNLTEAMFASKIFNVDGITSNNYHYGTNYIIFNRNALVVNEEDFKDVIKSSIDCEPGEDE